MKTYLISCIAFIPLLRFMGCQEDPQPVIELLMNGDMESGDLSPDYWFRSAPTVYTAEWTSEAANSGAKSLKVNASDIDGVDNNFAFWSQNYNAEIPTGKELVLSVKIKCKDVSGNGIYLAIRADSELSNFTAEQFATTQESFVIRGTFDWTTYQVRLNQVNSDIKLLTVYLIMGSNTVGTVYFDDASLIAR